MSEPVEQTSGNETWSGRVSSYLNELEQIAETIDLVLDGTRVQTTNMDAHEVSQSTAQLEAALLELEEKIAERESLLRDADAPAVGLTLSTKLLGTRRIDDARLAKRCKKVAEMIATAHQRAISLFVCQYHLADLTGDIVRVLSGATGPDTYAAGNRDSKPAAGRGGIFDEAA